MEPALHDGDRVLFVRLRPAVGDVVVAEHPARPGFDLVKRVAGAPGDVVGTLPGGARLPEPVRLGPGEWFLVGDRPDASTDSRHLGPVGAIRGVVRVVAHVHAHARAGGIAPVGRGNTPAGPPD